MKKTLSTILALVMLVSMAIPMFAVAEEAAYLPTTWEPFAEKVTITVPVYDRSKEGYPAVDDNYWTRYIQAEFGDKYNVEVKYVAIPRGDVMTKYSLLIVGKETPTIMMEYDYPKVAEWALSGAMQTIDLEAFKAVAPNYYASMEKNNQLGYSKINGENFFVLSERPYYNTPYTFYNFVRLDWLEAIGMEQPRSYEDTVKVIDAIIEKGLTDKAPIGLTVPGDAYARNFGFRDFPVDEKEWAIYSSLGTASLSWYATERMMRRYNAEYQKGWYSSEFELGGADNTGTVASDMQSDFINGKIYRYGGYMAANVDWLKAFYENNPDAKLAVELPGGAVEEGVAPTMSGRSDNAFGMIVGFSSLATEDQLKAAWMLMEWMHNPEVLFVLENGIEGVTYEINPETGLPVTSKFADYRGEEMLNHNDNIDMTCLVHASKVNGTVEQSIALIAPQGLPQDFTQEMIDLWYINKENADKGLMYTDPVYSVGIEAEAEYNGALLPLWVDAFTKLTKAAPEEFDALYAQLSQEYLDAGYQEILDERLAAYEAGQTTTLPDITKKK